MLDSKIKYPRGDGFVERYYVSPEQLFLNTCAKRIIAPSMKKHSEYKSSMYTFGGGIKELREHASDVLLKTDIAKHRTPNILQTVDTPAALNRNELRDVPTRVDVDEFICLQQ